MILGYDMTAREVAEHIWQLNCGNMSGMAHDLAVDTHMTYDEICDALRDGTLEAVVRCIEREVGA